MQSAPSPPPAPDPTTEANAQTASNQQTALYNFGLNNPDTYTPLGNLTYSTDTSNPNQPSSTANITLSPAEQQILQQNQSNITQQGQVANTALQGVQNQFNTPYNLTGNVPQTPSQQDLMGNLQNTQNALYGEQTQYLDPQFQQGQQQLESQLANQGIPQGSQAYTTAMNNFALQKQQAYSNANMNAISGGTAAQAQLANTGLANQAQAAQLYNQQYSAPLANYNSLMTGTQPSMPQFNALNPSSAAPTNVLGAYNQAYQGQLNAYNAQTGAANSSMSGLFGLGGSALGAFGSFASSPAGAAMLF